MEPTPKSDDPRPEADDDLFAPPSAATEAMLAQLAQMAARPADRVPLPPPPEFAAGPRVPPSLDIAPIPIDDTPQPRRRLGRLAVAAGIGVALVLGWLSYGDAAKQVMTSPLAGPASPEAPQPAAVAALPAPTTARTATVDWPAAPAEPPVPAAAAPAPAVPPALTQQIDAMARELASLRQSVDQLTTDKEQMGRTLARLQAAEAKQAADREARRKASAAAAPKTLGAPERPLGSAPAQRAPITSAPLPPNAQASAEPLPAPPRRPPAGLPIQLQ